MRTWRRVPLSGRYSFYSVLRWSRDASRWFHDGQYGLKMVKMAQDGLRWSGGGLGWLRAVLELARHGSLDGLRGGFQSMKSYKNEQSTINTWEHNVDTGFKPFIKKVALMR